MKRLETICPYPGLRPFTEEESLYFKGREEQILKVTAQLEEKKFLMVTGASGDGKSSLIYAGLVPQARAGFFKAKCYNWHVAGFRPERSPMKNMADALAQALEIDAPDQVEVELSRGFSSLTELYKSSKRYIDEQSPEWKNADEDQRDLMQREAGNLLILIDQFEEFFTNPENFPGGVPSQESRLLLNIVLETAKIALKEDLPIYVVCTMRSDYIGQCAAFRGLPEFIGFSQFFVPRLQRKELRQVIEEPAILSGNRISNRLIDRLIFDLEEGTDQLPILQHALKQIWKAANSGQDEMDLIHYAMVGGMPGDKLPKEEISSFQLWKESLPDYEKKYLEHTGLSNVLDIHANKLYEQAAAAYNKTAVQPVTDAQAKLIIAISFACLTRIDESRAVRNRMTLLEITQIINVPSLTTEVVGGVLNIFRESENTLIGPFISEEDNGRILTPDTVIDITHEALIRNWQLLKKWAAREYEYYETFLDFQQQLNRWIAHGKSSDFLLPIGPLTYFENWYANCRPNTYWINRYLHDEGDPDTKLKKADTVLKNTRNFIRKSALRLLVTRTFMRYGAARISIISALIALMVFSGYFIYQWRVRDNDYVLNKMLNESDVWLADREPTQFTIGFFVVEAERFRPGYLKEIIGRLPDQQAIDAALHTFIAITNSDFSHNSPVLLQSLQLADSLVQSKGERIDSSSNTELSAYLNSLNDLVRNQSYYLFNRSNRQISEQRDRNVQSQAKLLKYIFFRVNRTRQLDMKALHIAVTDVVNNKALSDDELNSLISVVSPIENNTEAQSKFNAWFPANEKILAGAVKDFSHNGGYQMLAYLYAATGNVKQTMRCMDTLNHYNRQYDKAFINSIHVAATFLVYEEFEAFNEFVKLYAQTLGIPAHVFVNELLMGAGIVYVDNIIKFIKHGNINDITVFLRNSLKEYAFKYAYKLIAEEQKVPDAYHFAMAMQLKLEGVLMAKKGREANTLILDKTDSLFSTAFAHFNRVSAQYLDEKIPINVQTFDVTTERRTLARRQLFLFPDQFKSAESFIQPAWFRYYDAHFFDYMKRNNLFEQYYRTSDDYQMITNWISTYFSLYMEGGNRGYMNYPDPGYQTFKSIDSLISKSGHDLDDAWIKLYLIEHYFAKGDTSNAFLLVKSLKFKEFQKSNFEEFQPFHRIKVRVASKLAIHGNRAKSMNLIRMFANRRNRVTAYASVAAKVYQNGNFEEADVYLDSAWTELGRVKNQAGGNFRRPLVEVLALKGGSRNLKLAYEYIGSMAWGSRIGGIIAMLRGHCWKNNYYEASVSVPELASADDKLGMAGVILFLENLKRSETSGEWNSYNQINEYSIEQDFYENDLIVD